MPVVRAISIQPALDRLPSDQNTMLTNWSTVPRYWPSDVSAENRNICATPVSISVSDEAPFIRAMVKMKPAENRAQAKDPRATARLDGAVPANRMTHTAPNPAADETPNVDGEASGLSRTAWKTVPEIPRPNPTSAAISARGTRKDQRMACCWPLSVNSARMIAGNDMSAAP